MPWWCWRTSCATSKPAWSLCEAALRGSAEVGFTVISMSLSLIAVFLPILLMPGIVGLLFHEFAVTLSIAILFSLLISLTVTPTMCAYLLGRGTRCTRRPRWAVWVEAQFERFKNAYSRSLTAVLDHSLLVGLLLIALIVLNVFLFRLVPSTFFPEQDNGLLIGQIIADQSISFPAMEKKLAQLQEIVQTGSGGRLGGRLHRRPRAQSPPTCSSSSSRWPSATCRPTRWSTACGPSSIRSPARGLFLQAAAGSADRRPAVRRRIPVHADQRGYRRAVRVDAEARDRAQQGPRPCSGRQLGPAAKRPADLPHDQPRRRRCATASQPNQIDNVLYDAFGQRTVSTIYNPFNQYFVVMEVAPKYWQYPQMLDRIYLSTAAGNAERHPADAGAGRHRQRGDAVRRRCQPRTARRRAPTR